MSRTTHGTGWAVLALVFVSSASLAQIGGAYNYTAELETRALHQGVVYANGLSWSCRSKRCTVDTQYARLDLLTCQELAGQVGPITEFGRPGWRLSRSELRWCNAYAATQDSQQPGITIGGPGQRPAHIPLPGGSPTSPSPSAEGGPGERPPEPPRVDRIEYRAAGSAAELYVRGANFPVPRAAHTLLLLPTRRGHCLGKCQEQFEPYERALSGARVGLWNEDLVSLDLEPFTTDPYTLEEFLAQLVTMIESHYVEIRTSAGQPVAGTTVPVSRFGELDIDVDRDGHSDQRLGGDDCNDEDASLTTDCES